jgi:hypothetical protein
MCYVIACIDYNFAVEFVEHDLFHAVIKQTPPVIFKSEAVPKLTSTNKKVNLDLKFPPLRFIYTSDVLLRKHFS